MYAFRRPTRLMSMRRRQDGLNPMDIENIHAALDLIRQLLQIAFMVPFNVVRVGLVASAAYLYLLVRNSLIYWRAALDPIDPANKDRDIESFTEEECYANFRFTKAQMHYLVDRLGIRQEYRCDNGICFPGEYGLCLYLYTLSYPVKLQRLQNDFGREYSQISRIRNRMKYWLYRRHSAKVLGNLEWYAGRFNMYADAINNAVAYSHENLAPGNVPPELLDICCFLDGTTEPICRIFVSYVQYHFVRTHPCHWPSFIYRSYCLGSFECTECFLESILSQLGRFMAWNLISRWHDCNRRTKQWLHDRSNGLGNIKNTWCLYCNQCSEISSGRTSFIYICRQNF